MFKMETLTQSTTRPVVSSSVSQRPRYQGTDGQSRTERCILQPKGPVTASMLTEPSWILHFELV